MIAPLLLMLAAAPVAVEFEGTLKDAITEVAKAGELNVVVMGEFNEPAQLRLNGVDAQAALEVLAEAYGLDVNHTGELYVIRRAAPVVPAAALPPAPAAPPAPRPLPSTAQGRVGTGGSVTVANGERVESAVAWGGSVTVEEGAQVEKDAVAFGGDVVLKPGSMVEGDAVAFGGNVVREDGATLKGDAVAFGGSTVGTTVKKSVEKVKQRAAAPKAKDTGGFSLAAFLLEFAALFGVGFVMLMLAPQRVQTMETALVAEPWKNGFAGTLGLITLVPLSVALAFTVIGIPVALLLWLLVAMTLPVSVAMVAHLLGRKLPTAGVRKTQALALALGLLVLLVAFNVPVLGALLGFAVFSATLGVVIRTRFGQPRRGLPIADSHAAV